MPVMPAESQWMIQRGAADPTSGSLQEGRGTFIVPAEARWMIERCGSDPTSGSLRKVKLEGRACHARGSLLPIKTKRPYFAVRRLWPNVFF